MKLVAPLNANLNEIQNVLVQSLGTAPTGVEGRIYYDASLHAFRYHNGTGWISMLATPTGLDARASVRVASTANVNVASAPSTIDGVTLASGNRVLLKNQTDPAENGIRVFTSAGAALQRADDADASDEVTPGMFTFCEEGTANGDKGWVLTTDNPITLGTTGLTFTQFSGAGTVTGTSARITVSGTQVDIDAAYVGQTSITTLGTVTSGTWSATTIALNKGGTGATTQGGARTNLGLGGAAVLDVGTSTGTVAAGDDSRITGAAQKASNLSDLASAPTARTNLGLGGAAVLNVGTSAGTVTAGDDSRLTAITHKYETTIGDGAASSYTVTHSLGTKGVTVEVYEVSTGVTVTADITRTTTAAITVSGFTTVPTTNQYAVVVVG